MATGLGRKGIGPLLFEYSGRHHGSKEERSHGVQTRSCGWAGSPSFSREPLASATVALARGSRLNEDGARRCGNAPGPTVSARAAVALPVGAERRAVHCPRGGLASRRCSGSGTEGTRPSTSVLPRVTAGRVHVPEQEGAL